MGQTNGLASFSEDDIRQRIQDAIAQAQRQGGATGDMANAVVGMLGGMMGGATGLMVWRQAGGCGGGGGGGMGSGRWRRWWGGSAASIRRSPMEQSFIKAEIGALNAAPFSVAARWVSRVRRS